MKKNFLMAAVAVAAMFTSCSKENSLIDGPDGAGNEIKSPTYAAFNFNLGQPNSRAAGDFTGAFVAASVDESAIDKSDLRLMIFDASTKALEHNAMITGTTETVLLSAGTKKIFVIANMGNAGSKLKKEGADVTLASFNTTTAAATSTLDNFYKVVFDAGTPQIYSIDKDGARTFDIAPLYTKVSTGTPKLGLPMSNSNAVDYVLKAGVSRDDAQDTGVTPSTNGTNNNNRFNIQLDFLSAKAQLVVNVTAINVLQSEVAVISNPLFGIKNLAKNTNLVQNVPSGVKQSFYQNMFTIAGTLQSAFDAHFDQAANVLTPAPAVAGTSWFYVPENTGANLQRGQSSFYAMNLTYKPAKIVDVIKHELNTDKISYTYKTWDQIKTATELGDGNTSYIYTTKVVEGIPAGTYFKTIADFAKAAWIMKNDKPITDPSFSQGTANSLIAVGDYKTFTNAQSWYRVDIGSGSGTSTVYGVLRGNAYTATVNNITGPGEPAEPNLFAKPEDPVSARTYINVSVTAAVWNPIAQGVDL